MSGVRTVMNRRLGARFGAALAMTASALAVVSTGGTAAAAPSALTGTFYLTAGSCTHGSISGTYIQMILPSGSVSGPYMANSDSSCSNQDYTLLAPGTDGGLRFGSYQPMPSPPFDSAGNAQAHTLTAPAQYEGTAFATSTNPVDPQTHAKVPAPSLTVHGSQVTADVSSLAVTWNNQYFNQGSPKPDGSHPGITHGASGTYNASTGAMSLSWTSQVVGGPFDKFTGSWHFVGRFVPDTTSGTSGGTPSGAGAATSAPGAVASPGATASASAAAGHGKSSTGSAQAAATSAASPVSAVAASTSVVTKHTWGVSWWLIAVVLIVAAAGFGGLAALPRSKPEGPGEKS